MVSSTSFNSIAEVQKEWDNPYVQWYAAGMPTFVGYNLAPWRQLSVYFPTKEDREHFAKFFNYNLTDKTKVVWFPIKEVEKNNMNRVIEDDPNV
jgi:hypothetical protein